MEENGVLALQQVMVCNTIIQSFYLCLIKMECTLPCHFMSGIIYRQANNRININGGGNNKCIIINLAFRFDIKSSQPLPITVRSAPNSILSKGVTGRFRNGNSSIMVEWS